MLRRLWLSFAQAVTVGLGLIFVVQTLRPQWVARVLGPPAVELRLPRDAGPANTAAPLLPIAAPGHLGAGPPAVASYAEAARRAMPAVVNIYTAREYARTDPADPLLRQLFNDHNGIDAARVSVLGSGVIVTAAGYVVTNNHVVENAEEIAVALNDGRRVDAKLVGADPETDLAVLKIELAALPVIAIGHSEQLKVGDVVLAIGNPYDVGQTVTMGIVSALGRSNIDVYGYEDFIQTDAAISQGNSGGALIDTNGELVGINTAIYSNRSGGSLGIGFAIPSDTISQVTEELINRGHVRRGYFGIEPYDITPEIASSRRLDRASGVVVNTVIRDAPAGKAGILPDDVLVAINGQPVTARRNTLAQIAKLEPGTTAKVTVLRQGQQMDFKVNVAERPPAP